MKHCCGHGRIIACLAIVLVAGCSGEDKAQGPDLSKLVPVSGIATLDDTPVADANVTFVPKSKDGFVATGRTDASGKYEVATDDGKGKMTKGVVPGDYNVVVTKFTGVDGKPIKLDPKVAPMNQGAVQGLPFRYSGVGEMGLSFTVPPGGGTYDIKMEK